MTVYKAHSLLKALQESLAVTCHFHDVGCHGATNLFRVIGDQKVRNVA